MSRRDGEGAGAGAELRVACELSPDELEPRRAALLPGLVEHAVSREELADGFRWRFEPRSGLLGHIAAVVDAERSCCRFLRFRLEIEPDGGAFSLEVTGPEGTVAFLSRLAEA